MTDQKPTCHNCRTYGTPQCPDCGGRKYDTLCIEHPRLREWLNRKEINVISKFGDMEIHQFSATTVLKILRGEWLHD